MDEKREDRKPERDKDSHDGKHHHEDHGRVVTPHRSSAQILKRTTTPS